MPSALLVVFNTLLYGVCGVIVWWMMPHTPLVAFTLVWGVLRPRWLMLTTSWPGPYRLALLYSGPCSRHHGGWSAHAGQNVRKLVKDGFVIRKPAIIHSRARARTAAEARSKGRHTGYGALTAGDWLWCPVCEHVWTRQVQLGQQWLVDVAGGPATVSIVLYLSPACWCVWAGAQTQETPALLDQVSAMVPVRRACPPRSCGSAAPACCVACSRSTVTPRRSTSTCTTSCTCGWVDGSSASSIQSIGECKNLSVCPTCASLLPCWVETATLECLHFSVPLPAGQG